MGKYGKGCDQCGHPELDFDRIENKIFCFNCGWSDSSVDYNKNLKEALVKLIKSKKSKPEI
jgi:hypothetical protein